MQDEHGRTALHYAAQCDDVLAICHLIVFGATVDMKDKDGITPIMLSRGMYRGGLDGDFCCVVRDVYFAVLRVIFTVLCVMSTREIVYWKRVVFDAL